MNDATTRQWPWQAALCTPDRKRKTVLLVDATGQPIGPKEGLQAARSFALDGPGGLAFMSAQAHDGGWGFLDTEGEWRVPPVYQDTRNAAPNGIARFKQGGCWGYMRMTGEVLVEPRFEKCGPFRHGVAAVQVAEKEWRFIDEQGRFTGKRTHHELGDMGDAGLARAMRWNITRSARHVGFVDRDGEWVINPDFGLAMPFGPHKVTAARKEQDKLYGLIDTRGQWVLEPCHGAIEAFDDDGYASFRDASSRDHKYGFLGLQGQVLIEPQVNMEQHRVCGLARQGCSFWKADGTRLDTQGIHMATDFRPLGRVALVRMKHLVAGQDWSDHQSDWGLLHTDGRVVSMPEHLREPLTNADDWLLAERGDTPYVPFIDRNGDLVWVDSEFYEVARVHLATGSAQMHTAAGEVWSSTDTALGPVQPFFDPPTPAVLQDLKDTNAVWPLLEQLRHEVEERLHQVAQGRTLERSASNTAVDDDDDDDDWDDEDDDDDADDAERNAQRTRAAQHAETRRLSRLVRVERRLARHYISEEHNGPYEFLCDEWSSASRALREEMRRLVSAELGPADPMPEWAGKSDSIFDSPGWAIPLSRLLPGDDGSLPEHRQLWACVCDVQDCGDGDAWWETWLVVAPSVDALALALRARRGEPSLPPPPDEAATVALLASDPYALEHIPRERLTDRMIDTALEANAHVFKYVPRRLMTPERYTLAVRADKLKPSDVPPDMLTEAACLAHVSHSGWGLSRVPEAFRTTAVYLQAIQRTPAVQKDVPAAVLDELRAAGHEIPDPDEQWRKLRKSIDATLERVNARKADPVMQMLLEEPKTPWQRVRRGFRLGGWMLSSAVKPRTNAPATHRGLTGWLEIRPVMSLIANTV
ncbi:MAG: hypothetical protein C0453_05355, partial [Comamonadaceae bacterium]|nr:hypothetical protein [Comamonadaceae bacterium]